MQIIQSKTELNQTIARLKKSGKKIGFVPTMGALHDGHLSLVAASNEDCDITVVSIFVNPTQFNNRDDFEKYPLRYESDVEKLLSVGCDILFYPDEKEMYPETDTRQFDFDGIDKTMEGAFRPGHFNGVAQIVSKLFDVVEPDKAFFGQKDFQQLAIIRKMVEKQNYPVQIVACPIVREDDGLAMSSRNLRLNALEREKAGLLSKCLFYVKEQSGKQSPEQLKEYVKNCFINDPVYAFEYFEIVHSQTLEFVKSWDEPGEKTACIAVQVGPVRLIDNIVLSAS